MYGLRSCSHDAFSAPWHACRPDTHAPLQTSDPSRCLQYVFTGMANNEFSDPKYQDPGALGADVAPDGLGKYILDQYQFNQGTKWRYAFRLPGAVLERVARLLPAADVRSRLVGDSCMRLFSVSTVQTFTGVSVSTQLNNGNARTCHS
jgi:hypothetical protein